MASRSRAVSAVRDGNGGDATGITVTNKCGVASLAVLGGKGSDGGSSGGSGGDSGHPSKVTVNNTADIAEKIQIGTEGGASADGGTGNGGYGGDANDIKVTDKFGTRGTWFIYAGSGGGGRGPGSAGGDGGNLKTVTFTGPKSRVVFGTVSEGDNDGGDGALSSGGDGGLISSLKGTAATLRIAAHRGGDADGIGGAGGSIENVTFSVANFARTIAAGDGGWVDVGDTAGLGGSITNVKITGSGVIGDFSEHFLVMADADTGMGGLVAGQGGAVNDVLDVNRNGNITGVTATRIAAVIAGAQAGLNVTNFNAVRAISGLKAALIGADWDGDRQFDWIENTATQTGFQLPGAPSTTDLDDVPGDGLIIVKTGGYAEIFGDLLLHNQDATIGSVSIKGDLIAFHIGAAIATGVDGLLLTADDVIASGGNPNLVSRIGRVIVGGMAASTHASVDPTEGYYPAAQKLGSVKVAGVALPIPTGCSVARLARPAT